MGLSETADPSTARRDRSASLDPDRANLAGITNMDVANSTTSGMAQRSQLSDIQNMYQASSGFGRRALWQDGRLCRVVGHGRTLRVFVTKLQVPVMYAIFVLDFKILK